MPDYLQLSQQAARAGAEQLESYRSRFQTASKGTNDLVTDADFASQRAIHDCLKDHVPDHGFLGEENLDLSMIGNSESPFRWIVDPLDGTLNYVHQLPSWSVSVALEHNDEIVAASVYDPCTDEMFSACVDGAATLNNRPLTASSCDELGKALLIVSLPANLTPANPEINDLVKLLCGARSVRRLGSAALNLCYVAAGRVDAYWATSLNLWDLAAGWLIVERAGGVTRHVDGTRFDPRDPRLIAASTDALARQIVSLLND